MNKKLIALIIGVGVAVVGLGVLGMSLDEKEKKDNEIVEDIPVNEEGKLVVDIPDDLTEEEVFVELELVILRNPTPYHEFDDVTKMVADGLIDSWDKNYAEFYDDKYGERIDTLREQRGLDESEVVLTEEEPAEFISTGDIPYEMYNIGTDFVDTAWWIINNISGEKELNQDTYDSVSLDFSILRDIRYTLNSYDMLPREKEVHKKPMLTLFDAVISYEEDVMKAIKKQKANKLNDLYLELSEIVYEIETAIEETYGEYVY